MYNELRKSLGIRRYTTVFHGASGIDVRKEDESLEIFYTVLVRFMLLLSQGSQRIKSKAVPRFVLWKFKSFK